jgi:tetratricopeptide (TPR) repeat protein
VPGARESWPRRGLWPVVLLTTVAVLEPARDFVINLVSGLVSDWASGNRLLVIGACSLIVAAGIGLAWKTARLAGQEEPPQEAKSSSLTSGVMSEAGHYKPSGAPICAQPTEPRCSRADNLPSATPNFAGRGDLLRLLSNYLSGRQGGARIALSGIRGSGKTQLVLKQANLCRDQYQVCWFIPARQPASIPSALRELSRRLGVDSQSQDSIAALYDELDRRGRWLFIFDDAPSPAELVPFLPTGDSGQVLITSQNPDWSAIAVAVEVPCLSLEEAKAFLLAQTGNEDGEAAHELAVELGGLPLALAQAVAYMHQKPGVTLRGYLSRYRQSHQYLLADGQPLDYPATVAATWGLLLEELTPINPAAVQLLRLLSFLASDTTIPLDLLLRADSDRFPPELRTAVRHPISLDEVTKVLYRYSLVSSDHDGVRVHRLVQTITRDHLNRRQTTAWAGRALALVHAAFPSAPADPENWPEVPQLLPHALAVSQHNEEANPDSVRELLDAVGVYYGSRDGKLEELNEARKHLIQALALAEDNRGPQDPEVARVLSHLGAVLAQLGEISAAQDALKRAVCILESIEHPDELQLVATLNNLGNVLRRQGDMPTARATIEHAMQILETAGAPDGVKSILLLSLGEILWENGDLPTARRVVEQALHIQDAIYEPDHLQVARTSRVLAGIIHEDGNPRAARKLFESALHSFEATYGPDHPLVLGTSFHLGLVLIELGRLPTGVHLVRKSVAAASRRLLVSHPHAIQWRVRHRINN